MSEFSDRCKNYLDENGTSVYGLSQSSGLERTSLQRMVTGKRLPSVEFVNRFCDSLRVSKEDRKQLMRLYQIEKLGASTYQNRMCIEELIHSLGKHESDGFQEFLVPLSYKKTKTEEYLGTVLKDLFTDSETYLYTNFPTLSTSLFPTISDLQKKYEIYPKIYHFIQFQIHATEAAGNLSALKSVLPMTLSEKWNYVAFYFYNRMSPSDYSQLLFPYYIVTHKHLLAVSSDFNHCTLYSESDIVNRYRDEFLRIKEASTPLLERSTIPKEAMETYVRNLKSQPALVHTLEPQPCYIDVMKQNEFAVLSSKIEDPSYRNMGLYIAESFWEVLASQNRVCYFSKPGLEYFCETGKFVGQIASYLPAFSVKQRIVILNRMLQLDYSTETGSHFMTDDTYTVPLTFSFELYDCSRLQIIRIDENKEVTFFSTAESSICEAFYDYADSMKFSEHILDDEQVKSVITACIDKLQKNQDVNQDA